MITIYQPQTPLSEGPSHLEIRIMLPKLITATSSLNTKTQAEVLSMKKMAALEGRCKERAGMPALDKNAFSE
jgi:hypothetical protein